MKITLNKFTIQYIHFKINVGFNHMPVSSLKGAYVLTPRDAATRCQQRASKNKLTTTTTTKNKQPRQLKLKNVFIFILCVGGA